MSSIGFEGTGEIRGYPYLVCKKYILLFRCRLFRGRKLCIELSGISLFYDNAQRDKAPYFIEFFSASWMSKTKTPYKG